MSGIFTFRKDIREQRREQSHAIQLAIETLEDYTRACKQMIFVDEAAQQEAARLVEYSPLDQVTLPPFSYPKTIEWKWIVPQTSATLRSILPDRNDEEQRIYNLARFCDADPFSLCDEITAACATLGLKAWAIARAIRTQSNLLNPDIDAKESDILQPLHDRKKSKTKLP